MIDRFLDWLSDLNDLVIVFIVCLFLLFLIVGATITLEKISCYAIAYTNPTLHYEFSFWASSTGCLVQNPTNGIWIPTDQFNGVTVIK